MFNIDKGKKKKDKYSNEEDYKFFNAKSVEDFIERITFGLNKALEDEIREQISKLKVEYKRDKQNAINTGLTANIEEKAKEWICPRIPKWVNSDMLTGLGIIASIIIAISFVLGFFNRYYLILVVIGLLLHWFGDSFDGSLARYRKKTRPNYGYYIDHIVDSIAVLNFGLGLGLSGFVKIEVGFLFVIMYLILMIHVELVTYVQNEFKYSFGLIGPTEYRIIGIIFTMVMFFMPVRYFEIYGHYLTQYDFGVILLSLIMFGIILYSIISKGMELDRIDKKRWEK
jgi:archaetidylinositol phosphate synthase